MKVFLGGDHRGFERKEQVERWLVERSYEVVDVGAHEFISGDDYVDYVREVFAQIDFENDRAILFCGSGHGVEIAANRHPQVRAILGFNKTVATQGRMHENANVLTIATDWVGEQEAIEIVAAFMSTAYAAEERHVRRLAKIDSLSQT
jgi:ribose 5-phosphate isomerase B